ncbi:MAG: nucleotidyltransferase family protein [Bacteroidetes bacterium]|jgi:NDP-sugar pyrophosphorylase family protein|nr:nucleotidyltransferase family protein [Bacteroidota bacterium]MDF1864027.1 nucleotidyltransferase family protein [Saprospiraceae bacterium]
MKAMIFAAGLGTRLRPLTNDRPKALVEINGKPLLEIAIRRLKYFGFQEIIINIHHFGELILDFLKKNNDFGITIEISDERDLLLETGGGLKKATSFFDDGMPFLVCNADILTNLNLKELYDFHLKNNPLATLAVRNRKTSRYLLFNEKNKELVGWENQKTGEVRWSKPSKEIVHWAFSGIHVIDPKIFELMPNQTIFSIIEVYLSAAKEHSILGFLHDNNIWLDVGKPESLAKAQHIIDKINL